MTSQLRVTVQAAGVGPSNSEGIAAAGVVILDAAGLPLVYANHKLHDLASKRVAEWSAVCLGLRKAHELGATSAVVQIDADAVVSSLGNGGPRKKQGSAWRLRLIALEHAQRIGDVEYELISTEQNAQASSLAYGALHGRPAVKPSADDAP